MVIKPQQEKPNNFEIGIAYQSMSRIKFLEYLLTIRPFAKMKQLVSMIKQMIDEIKTSDRYAFWSHAKSILPHKGGVEWDAYDYTKTDKYATSEKVLFDLMGYNEAYHNPEITAEYLKVKGILTTQTQKELAALNQRLNTIPKSDTKQRAAIKKQIWGVQKKENRILKDLSLSGSYLQGLVSTPEFVYQGKPMVLMNRNTFLAYRAFIKTYSQTHEKHNDRIFDFGGDYALVEANTDLYKAFLLEYSLTHDPHDQSNNPEHDPAPEKKKQQEKAQQKEPDKGKQQDVKPDPKPDKAEPQKEAQQKNEPSKGKQEKGKDQDFKDIVDKEKEHLLQDSIASKIKNNPQLNVTMNCKTRLSPDLVIKKDDRFAYIKLPQEKFSGILFEVDGLDLKQSVIRFPLSCMNQQNGGYELNVCMGDRLQVLDQHLDHIFKDGESFSVKGADIIRAFIIDSEKSVEFNMDFPADMVIDGVPYRIDSGFGFVYARTDNEVKILKGNTAGEVLIPDQMETDTGLLPVTGILENAFANSDITAVKIPDSVKEISVAAFSNCKSLKEVSFGAGVERIEASVFRDCSALTNLNIPASVKELDVRAFEGCQNVELTIDEQNPYLNVQDYMQVEVAEVGKEKEIENKKEVFPSPDVCLQGPNPNEPNKGKTTEPKKNKKRLKNDLFSLGQ